MGIMLTMLCLFQRSLTSLKLTEVTPVAVGVESAPIVISNDETVQPVLEESSSSSSSSSSLQMSVNRQGPRREPSREFINVLEKFSKVTKFARDTTAHLFGESSRLLGNSEMDLDRAPMRSVCRLFTMN